jgi:hypothetical protein
MLDCQLVRTQPPPIRLVSALTCHVPSHPSNRITLLGPCSFSAPSPPKEHKDVRFMDGELRRCAAGGFTPLMHLLPIAGGGEVPGSGGGRTIAWHSLDLALHAYCAASPAYRRCLA